MPLVIVSTVKSVVRVKPLPSPEQAAALAATLHACNEAASYVSRVVFETTAFRRNDLQRRVYARVKASFGFVCVVCGLAGPADHVSAVNVRERARRAWVFVNCPYRIG